MPRRPLTTFLVLIASITAARAARAAGPATQPESRMQATQPARPPALTPADQLAITTGTVEIAGRPVPYTATAGYMPLKNEQGKLQARIFYVAYTARGPAATGQEPGAKGAASAAAAPSPAAAGHQPLATSHQPLTTSHQPLTTRHQPLTTSPSPRPLTFVFNGGPGAAAVWLHLGAAGPKRLDIPADGRPPGAPYHLVDNPYSWLAATDLVFVDPVSTGYSRPATPAEGKEFHGVREDIISMGEFIRLYLTQNQRWDSPLFLAGESYGTTRAAGLADYLQRHTGASVSGVILLSTVLNFAVLMPRDSNDLPYELFLPSYTAIALYHGKIHGDRATLLKESQDFALGDYAHALALGATLPPPEKARIAARLAQLTGLSQAYILESDLRIGPDHFRKELLRSQGKILGRYDARLTGDSTDPPSSQAEWDPSFDGFFTAYTSAFNTYIRATLHYENDLPYEVLTGRVQPWDFQSGGWNGYLYVGDDLRDAMTHNPHLKVLVGAGWYDLATPYFSVDYTINHLHLAPDLRRHITQTYYPTGHMIYQVHAGLEKLQKDITRFITSATGTLPPATPAR